MGGGSICSRVFFVQTILADRYIHRRELRLVSLESSSSVKFGIKKIFLIFLFYGELLRFKLSRFFYIYNIYMSKGRRGLIRSYDFGTVLINNVFQLCFVSLDFFVTVFGSQLLPSSLMIMIVIKMPGF